MVARPGRKALKISASGLGCSSLKKTTPSEERKFVGRVAQGPVASPSDLALDAVLQFDPFGGSVEALPEDRALFEGGLAMPQTDITLLLRRGDES